MIKLLLEQAIAVHRSGDLDAARAAWMGVLAQAPAQPDALRLLGLAHLQQGRPAEAAALLRRALAIKPDMAEAWTHLAMAMRAAELPGEAAACWRQVLRLRPGDPAARRAMAVLRQGATPENPSVLHERAAAAYARRDYAAALDLYRQAALRLDDPGIALANAAGVLVALGQPAAALATLEAVPQQGHPAAAACWRHRAAALGQLDRPEQALEACRRCLELEPEDADALFALACNRLLLGDYPAGWAGYEHRWKLAGAQSVSTAPLWLGRESLAGRTLLLRAEQGFGDILQFVRYATLLRGRAARLVLAVPAELLRLLDGLADVVVDHDKPLPSHDFQVPLMSLPLALGTTLASVPADIPYLHADPALRAAWRARLGERRGPRVGVAWTGDPRTPRGGLRRVPPEMLLPALAAALAARGGEVHVLQKVVADEDRAWLGDARTHAAELTDFAETAALAAEMDVVVSSCTSVAHLAGGLGRPLLVMLQFAADFRWLRHRADSPWYPTARLFRQPAPGDWAPVIEAVAGAVRG